MNKKWQNKLRGNSVFPWLLESNPWTKYRTFTDLLDLSPSSAEVSEAREELCRHLQVRSLVTEASQWFPQPITRHNDAKICYYKLMVLAEMGLNTLDKGVKELTDEVTEHVIDGMFAVRQLLPELGKNNQAPEPHAGEWHILPCDSPIITYSLLLMGEDSPTVKQSAEALAVKWDTPQGWFCHFPFVEGQYKKLQAGCPMAGLMALEVFSQVPDLKESRYARNAFESLRFHKDYGRSIYYFGRSRKFFTLKYPFIWYNALYLADVLTRFEFLRSDSLVGELVSWIEESQDEKGRFRPTSTWIAYKEWEFANKKEPSPWITFLCSRILKRWYR